MKHIASCEPAGPALMEEDLPQVHEATRSLAQQVEVRHMLLLTSVLARSHTHPEPSSCCLVFPKCHLAYSLPILC